MADRAPRRAVLALLAAGGMTLLAGCGFRPLYGQSGGGNSAALAQVAIDPIADRIGQKMHNLLLERLTPKGPPDRPLYRLSVKLTESKQELAIRKDESATRANLTVTAQFRLIFVDRPDLGELTGSAVSTNSYNVLASEFATLSAENDARNRALATLAEEIRMHVAAGLLNPQLFIRQEPRTSR